MTQNDAKPTTATYPTYMTPEEVAEVFDTTVESLAQMRYQDRGPAFSKFGRRIHYATVDVFDYVASTRYEPTN